MSQDKRMLPFRPGGAYTALALATWAYFAFRPEHWKLNVPPPAPAT
jgi:hypothetical protein